MRIGKMTGPSKCMSSEGHVTIQKIKVKGRANPEEGSIKLIQKSRIP